MEKVKEGGITLYSFAEDRKWERHNMSFPAF